jgi:hypothetical protein
LEEKAYFLHRLKILDFRPNRIFLEQTKTEKEERKETQERAKMYLMLSYFGSGVLSYSGIGPFTNRTLGYRHLNNAVLFNEFLSKYHMTEDGLVIWRDYYVNNARTSKHIRDFLPDPVYGIKIRILEERLNETITSISYEYALPGFTISEILRDRHHAEFSRSTITRSRIQEALDSLLDNGIMECLVMFEDEMRYKIRNPIVSDRARRAITECWDLHDEILSVICESCKKSDITKAEKNWLGFFYGNEPNCPIEQWLQELRHDRDKMRRYKSKQHLEKEKEKLMSSIQEKFERLIKSLDGAGTYKIFVDKILEYIYPHFMRSASRQ